MVHSFTSRQVLSLEAVALRAATHTPIDNAHAEVFNKTLGFFCALIEKGCSFSSVVDFPESSDTIQQENDVADAEIIDDSLRSRKHKSRKCHGRLELRHDGYNQPYIQ